MNTLYTDTILSSADIHLSANHFKYLEKPFEFFKNTVKEIRPLITVLSGDIFDTRVNADEDIYHYTINSILEITQYSKYVIVLDGTYSHDYNTLDILKTYSKFIKNLFFIKTKTILNINNLKILCLPEEYPDDKITFYSDIFNDKYDYVFGHGDIEGALLHSGADNTMLKGFKFNKEKLSSLGKYVIFGHYHKHQFLTDNLLYIGSLGRFKFGEEEDKGFIKIDNIYDEKPLLKFIVSPSVSMNTINLNNEDDLDNILSNYSQDTELKIKIPKIENLNKELLEKLDSFKGKLKIDYIQDTGDSIEDILEYKDIEKLDVSKQFLYMLHYEIEHNKIAKKNLKFFNDEVLIQRLNELIITN